MSGVRAPRQERGKASFERLLDVAESVLVEDGYSGLTIAALRERGISNGAIYWRVDSIESLFNAVHERFLLRVDAEQNAFEDDELWAGLSTAEFVEHVVRVEAGVFERHGGLLRALVLHEGVDEPSAIKGAEAVRGAQLRFVRRLSARLEQDKVPDPEATATMVFRLTFGTLMNRIAWPAQHAVGPQLSWEAYVDELCAATVAYVAARTPT
jgi:AcrR family transcriptional regulator